MAKSIHLRRRAQPNTGFHQPLHFGKQEPNNSTERNPSTSWWAGIPREKWAETVADQVKRIVTSRFNDIENASYSPHRFSEIRSKNNIKRSYGRDIVEEVTGRE